MDVQKLHEQIVSMELGDLLLLAGQAVNMGMDPKKVTLILRYVENAVAKYQIEQRTLKHDDEMEGVE